MNVGTKDRDRPDVQAPRFNGPDYDPRRDNVRLTGQLLRVFEAMKSGAWRTVEEIAAITGDPPTSISAQLRHLRKPRFGGYTVERRRRTGNLSEYRVVVPPPPRPEQGRLL